MTIDLGQTIDGKYRVVRHIGAGGMGTVFEGENLLIGRRVAIKLLHAQVASMPEFVERFEREARAAVRVGSPHICDVLDLGHLPNGDRFIVMEYLEGMSLEDRLSVKGKLTPQELAPIAFELLEGLGSMHAAGVVHRDLKPANIFLAKTRGGRGETVKILDFGVAKLQPKPGEVGAMTQTGAMMGTPLYMSPEQARGARDVDGRSDIYSASVIFYRALTGELPYMAQNLNELLFKIVLEDPRPIRELSPDIDETFAEIVHRGLTRHLEQRFAGARVYQEALAVWGRKQGRASLAFDVTLPTDPPPRPVFPSSPDATPSGSARSAAASSPAAPSTPAAGGTVANDGVARAVTPASGERMNPVLVESSEDVGASASAEAPKTPASAGSGPVRIGASSPVPGPAAGTPLSWSGASGSNPKYSSSSIPAASVQRRSDDGSLAATQASPSDPAIAIRAASERPDAAVAKATSAAPPAAARPAKSKMPLAGVGAVVVLGAIGLFVAKGGKDTPGASASVESAAPSTGLVAAPASAADTAAPPSSDATSASTGTTAPTSTISPAAHADAGATVTAVAAAQPRATATTAPTAALSAKPPATNAATSTTATVSATPTAPPAPTSSSHGRRFRTNLD